MSYRRKTATGLAIAALAIFATPAAAQPYPYPSNPYPGPYGGSPYGGAQSAPATCWGPGGWQICPQQVPVTPPGGGYGGPGNWGPGGLPQPCGGPGLPACPALNYGIQPGEMCMQPGGGAAPCAYGKPYDPACRKPDGTYQSCSIPGTFGMRPN